MKRKRYSTENRKILIVIFCIIIILIVAAVLLWMILTSSKEAPQVTTTPITGEVPVRTEAVGEVESEMLAMLAELHKKNPDVVGWIRFEGTKLDYPVMYTPDDEEKYLHRNMEGNYSAAGVPFIDKDCSLDPESDNVIIYGHNMKDGTAFKALFNYRDEKYWKEHPTFYYATLEEERTYEVMAVFYDRVYYKNENVFKFYQFIDPKNRNEFNEAMLNYQNKSLYNTGVTAEHGDKLLTLVTCSSHCENGRFVVVGKMVDPDEVKKE